MKSKHSPLNNLLFFKIKNEILMARHNKDNTHILLVMLNVDFLSRDRCRPIRVQTNKSSFIEQSNNLVG